MIISRYHDLEEITLDIEFVTPAFLGGADQNAELRSAPFKYGLRYWWRILYGNRYENAVELKKAEDEIFGSTETGSKVRMCLLGSYPRCNGKQLPSGKKVTVESGGQQMQMSIIDYLAYGKKIRGKYFFIDHGSTCQLCVYHPPRYNNQIVGALNAFLLYGGVGSRSRNGFGSITLNSSNEQKWENNISEPLEPKEFPVLNTQCRLFTLKNGYDRWEDALSDLGIYYKNARCSLEMRHRFERRGLIARPVEARGENIPHNIRRGRHPKPFYLGVQKRKSNYYGHILSIPIRFYEADKQEEYNTSITRMHEVFGESMVNETETLLSRMEVN